MRKKKVQPKPPAQATTAAPKPTTAVKVPKAVLEGITALQSTPTNLRNINQAVQMLRRLGHQQAQLWVQQNPSEYYAGLEAGFEAEG